MRDSRQASIFFFDEATGEFKTCHISRSAVQADIDRALVMPVPLENGDGTDKPITNEDARRLGSMLFLVQGFENAELRGRFEFDTAAPMNWSPAVPPDLP